MAENDVKSIRLALAKAIANKEIDSDFIEKAAKTISSTKHQIRGLDVCAYGFCIDYFVGKDLWKVLPDLAIVEGAKLRNIEIFPWGIVTPDFFRVRVTQELDVFKGMNLDR